MDQLLPILRTVKARADGPMLIFPGQRLIGCATAGGILNGVLYEVQPVGDRLTLREEGHEQVQVPWEQAGKVLRLSHALTVFWAQSRTLHGVVRICPGPAPGQVHRMFRAYHLLVAASRATAMNKLCIE